MARARGVLRGRHMTTKDLSPWGFCWGVFGLWCWSFFSPFSTPAGRHFDVQYKCGLFGGLFGGPLGRLFCVSLCGFFVRYFSVLGVEPF